MTRIGQIFADLIRAYLPDLRHPRAIPIWLSRCDFLCSARRAHDIIGQARDEAT